MTQDIVAALNIEIKKEMADRYFSFRKLIESDTQALNKAVANAVKIEQVVVIDLSRMYILLHDEQLIEKFLHHSGLTSNYYFDAYIVASPTIKTRMFQDISVWGLTWRGRFTKIFLNCYDDLCRHIDIFRSLREELSAEQELIGHTIDMFYRQNDISSMLGFFRSMDSMSQMGSTMEGSINSGFDESLQKKMKIIPPHTVDQEIDPLPPLVPAEQIKSKLKELAHEAFKHHPVDFTQ
ncbi:MAG: hypothetical protein PF442_00910 [Desulfobulbaceae bacterium]|jgi:hypothetical protein|nr:hypothetical protein [Desulfobulbaceae bacterium]